MEHKSLTRPSLGIIGCAVGATIGWVLCFVTSSFFSTDAQPIEGSFASMIVQSFGARSLFSLRLGAGIGGLTGTVLCLLTGAQTVSRAQTVSPDRAPIIKRHLGQPLTASELAGSYAGALVGFRLGPLVVMFLYLKYWSYIQAALGGHWWIAGLTLVAEVFCAFLFGIWLGGSSGRYLGRWVGDRAIELQFVLLVSMLVLCCSQFGYWKQAISSPFLPWGH
jgi:hypothetical protein